MFDWAAAVGKSGFQTIRAQTSNSLQEELSDHGGGGGGGG